MSNKGHDPINRYSRQILLPEFGSEGQLKLLNSSVLVVGSGGLASTIILYLASAGIGRIGIIDGDKVDISNLHRQIIHTNESIDQSKVLSAKERALAINPFIKIETYQEWFNDQNAKDLIEKYDFIIDAVDNFSVKYLINDSCVLLNKPFSHAGIVGWKGQIFTHLVNGPCLRCIIPDPTPTEIAPTCSKAGVLGPMVGIMGCIQALEVIKFLAIDQSLCSSNKLIKLNGKSMKFREINLKKDSECQVCGDNPTITTIKNIEVPFICELKRQ